MTTSDDKKSLLDNLREPFQAWVSAGSRLGDVVSDFADRLKEDRAERDTDSGRIQDAASEARAGLADASSAEDYRQVSVNFAGRAEEIFRDIAASVRRAAEETKDSASVEEARAAFSQATSSVRATFEETVEQVRSRRGTPAEGEQSLIDDLRARLDDLIERAGSALGGSGKPDGTDGTDGTDGEARFTPTAPSTEGTGDIPHMIDGEVVSSREVPEDAADARKDE